MSKNKLTREQLAALAVVATAARRSRPSACNCGECAKLDEALKTLAPLIPQAPKPELPPPYVQCWVVSQGERRKAYHDGYYWCVAGTGNILYDVTCWEEAQLGETVEKLGLGDFGL